MKIDANGGIHSESDGQFTGHIQTEGDTSLLDQPAAAPKSATQQVFDKVYADYEAMLARSKTSPKKVDRDYQQARADGLLDALSTMKDLLHEPEPVDGLRDELATWQSRRDWLNDRQEEIGGDDRLADMWDDSDTDAVDLVRSLIGKLGVTPAPINFCTECGDKPGSNRITCETCQAAEVGFDSHPIDECHYCGMDPINGSVPCPASPDMGHHRQPKPATSDRCHYCGMDPIIGTIPCRRSPNMSHYRDDQKPARPASNPNVDYDMVTRQSRTNWHGGA